MERQQRTTRSRPQSSDAFLHFKASPATATAPLLSPVASPPPLPHGLPVKRVQRRPAPTAPQQPSVGGAGEVVVNELDLAAIAPLVAAGRELADRDGPVVCGQRGGVVAAAAAPAPGHGGLGCRRCL